MGAGGQLQTVAIGIEKVDRLNEPVVDRSEHVDPVAFQPSLLVGQYFQGIDLKGQVLCPIRAGLLGDVGLVDHIEERHPATVTKLEKDVGMRGVLAGRGHRVLHDGVGQREPEDVGVELRRLLRVATAIGHVVESLHGHG